jgi:hypothetical protein
VVDAGLDIEPIAGWRVWDVSDGLDGPVLWPTKTNADPWPRGAPLEARCTRTRLELGRLKRHEAPDPGCTCGIYAADSLAFVERSRPAWPPPTVIGRVSLWGSVVAHEHGWRARFAYPERLRLMCAVCAWIEPGSGEPVVVHSFARRLYGLCDEHAGGLQLQDGRRTRRVETQPRELLDGLLAAYVVDLLPVEPVAGLFGRPPAPEVPPYVPTVRVLGLGG